MADKNVFSFIPKDGAGDAGDSEEIVVNCVYTTFIMFFLNSATIVWRSKLQALN